MKFRFLNQSYYYYTVRKNPDNYQKVIVKVVDNKNAVANLAKASVIWRIFAFLTEQVAKCLVISLFSNQLNSENTISRNNNHFLTARKSKDDEKIRSFANINSSRTFQ